MAKGYFSQCFCVLTDGNPTIAAVREAVERAGYSVAKEVAASARWEFGGPAIVIPFRDEVNGAVTIDVVNQPWPDDMGDPKSAPETFGAWSMGFFGPLTYPGAATRAVQHARWNEAASVVRTHRGIARMRMSYVGGLRASAPVLPRDYEALGELSFLNGLVTSLGDVPGVLCYFNPNGEVLRDLASFQSIVGQCAVQKTLPLLLWSHIRLFHLNENFGFMDSVGNGQFDLPDVEVIYPKQRYAPETID